MKNKFALVTTSLLLVLAMASCGGGSTTTSDEDEGISSLIPPTSVDPNYTYDDTDISGQPEKDVDTIRFHYRRNDDDNNDRSSYNGWGIWAWDLTNGGNGDFYKFDKADIYGVYVDIPATSLNATAALKEVGFLVALITKKGEGSYEWYNKDPDSDRKVDVSGKAPAGIKQVYTITKNEKVYENAVDPLKPFISYARVSNDSLKDVLVSISYVETPIDIKADRLSVLINGKVSADYTIENIKNSTNTSTVSFHLMFSKTLKLTDDISVSYRFDSKWTDSVKLLITNFFDSKEFVDTYAYSGNDLGVTFDNEIAPSKTTFKVWAPTSSKVQLNIYSTGNYLTDTNAEETIDMVLGEKGVWSYTKNANLDGKYYTYTVTNAKGVNEITDPYAKSAGVNGKRGMIVNFTQLNKEITGWADDVRPNYGEPADAIVYEIHVRDMTINPNSNVSEANRGRFLGLTEEGTKYTSTANGTTVTTGLDHLKELGITHVQIQPFYDYNSVDESLDNKEMSKTNYNWGYDPQNYNVLEGSYSTNPRDGKVRIKEFKQMVMALHKAGININMDVVYNHTGSTDGSNFQLLVPNYYYRTRASGAFYNGSGCGNEVASDRVMGRKFILDSIKFWTSEYHLSGYRFDLMGLEDNQTMIDVYDAVTSIYDKGMVYGEPWTGGSSKLASGTNPNELSNQQTVQSSLYQPYFVGNGKYVGAFNDIIRNAVKGDNNPGKGYVQGQTASTSHILAGMEGKFTRNASNPSDKCNQIEPGQVINYVSCHDNYTLHDQLIKTMTGNFDSAYLQAEAIILTSQGVAFMQEGEDFMRSKAYTDEAGVVHYEHNSYNVGDFINNMDYELKAAKVNIFNKFKEMINLRKTNDELTLNTRAKINELTSDLGAKGSVLSYKINNKANGGNDLIVVHGLNGEFDATGYEVIFSVNEPVYNGASISLAGNQTLVLRKA